MDNVFSAVTAKAIEMANDVTLTAGISRGRWVVGKLTPDLGVSLRREAKVAAGDNGWLTGKVNLVIKAECCGV